VKKQILTTLKQIAIVGSLALSAVTAQASCPYPFNEQDYLAYNPDVQLAVLNGTIASGYDHYYQHGINEGRTFNSRCALPNQCPFDETDYLTYNPDVADAISNGTVRSGLEHYVLHGSREGRTINRYCANTPAPCPYIERDYLAFNPDVEYAVISGSVPSAYAHYSQHGRAEGRVANASCNPLGKCPFVESDYLWLNPDVARAVQAGQIRSGLEHFVKNGSREGRSFNASCSEGGNYPPPPPPPPPPSRLVSSRARFLGIRRRLAMSVLLNPRC
jgi:hypothetical protein